jgi:restriction endonuclease S subunit
VELKDSGVEYLERIPLHWKVDRLKDIVSLRNSKTDESSEAEDYLELEDIEQGTGKILSKRNTLDVESAVTIFKKGDVLFGKLRPYLEKYYLADFDGKCTGEILAFEPIRIRGQFLLYCIASPWFLGQCKMLAYGAKMPRVNWPTQLAKINIPLPPDDDQEQIAAYLDVRCKEMIKLKKNINAQITILDQYRKSLIHECVTGKRRITEEDIRVVQQY